MYNLNQKIMEVKLKKKQSLTLDELLESIPYDFTYPNDVKDFMNTESVGKELI